MNVLRNGSRGLLATRVGLACALGMATAAMAGPRASTTTVPVPQPILTGNQLLWQVAPDECFKGVGVDYPPINPDGTCTTGQPKANQAYIWSLVEAKGRL